MRISESDPAVFYAKMLKKSPRSSGDTLTRENFYKMKSRLAEKRLLTMKTSNANGNGITDEDINGQGEEKDKVREGRLLREIRARLDLPIWQRCKITYSFRDIDLRANVTLFGFALDWD